jgi:single-strand DNA-binding protein
VNINSCVLVGRLTRDIEVRQIANGTSLGKLSLAVSERVKKGEEWEDRPSYFDLTLWGKRAESLAKWLTKGTIVSATCTATQDRWEHEGKKQSKVTFKVNDISFVFPDKGQSKKETFKDDIPF